MVKKPVLTLLILGLILLIVGVTTVYEFGTLGKTSNLKLLWKHDSALRTQPPSEGLVVTVPVKLTLSENAVVEISYQTNRPIQRSMVISLDATDFDISPEKEISHVINTENQTAKFSWLISPQKTGTYKILLSFSGIPKRLIDSDINDLGNFIVEDEGIMSISRSLPVEGNNDDSELVRDWSVSYPINVVNTFGFSDKVIKAAGYVISFMGSALTFPWWFALWEKRKEAKSKSSLENQEQETNKSKRNTKKHTQKTKA